MNQTFWFGLEDQQDIHSRATHPAWNRFGMSLTGAVIEAIARSWGVPLQDVLEASEFSTEGHTIDAVVGVKDGQEIVEKEVDRIRNPRR